METNKQINQKSEIGDNKSDILNRVDNLLKYISQIETMVQDLKVIIAPDQNINGLNIPIDRKIDIEEKKAEIIIKIENLTKGYTVAGKKTIALNNINLEVKKGEFIAIVGPSGAGKTTLINCIGGLDSADEGNILYDLDNDSSWKNITQMDDKDLKNLRLNKIGFVFQFYNLFPIFSAYENVQLPMIIAKKKNTDSRVKELLKMVGLKGRIRHRPTQMSGGEQQRVTIARALANEPVVILADEPTGELDTETTTQIMKIFLSLKAKGHTILMVTHNKRIAKIADTILTISDGQIINTELGGGKLEDIWSEI